MERRTVLRRADRIKGTRVRRGLNALGEELLRRRLLYALVCKNEDDRVVHGIGNGGVAEKEEDVGPSSRRRDSQRTLEGTREVERTVSRSGSSV